jgi:hypothetical protein
VVPAEPPLGADGVTVGARVTPPPDEPDDGAAVPPLEPAPAPELEPPLWLRGAVVVCEPGVGVGAGVDAGAAALLVLAWLPPPDDAAITISRRTKPTPASAVSLRRR